MRMMKMRVTVTKKSSNSKLRLRMKEKTLTSTTIKESMLRMITDKSISALKLELTLNLEICVNVSIRSLIKESHSNLTFMDRECSLMESVRLCLPMHLTLCKLSLILMQV